jgi:hypothetical protein
MEHIMPSIEPTFLDTTTRFPDDIPTFMVLNGIVSRRIGNVYTSFADLDCHEFRNVRMDEETLSYFIKARSLEVIEYNGKGINGAFVDAWKCLLHLSGDGGIMCSGTLDKETRTALIESDLISKHPEIKDNLMGLNDSISH